MKITELLAQIPVGTITTIAGVGYLEGIPARDAPAGTPQGVVRRADGDLIVLDMWAHRIWRIDKTGILHAFAGDGVPGGRGDGGPAMEARFYDPHDLTQDKHGNLYLTDLGNHAVRRIDHETGIITRVAGSGKVGRGGNGGPALEAEIDNDSGIAVDDDGNIFLSCEWSNAIRRIDAKTGVIDHFAGQEARHHLLEVGNSRPFSGPWLSLGGYHGDGGPAKEAGFHHPEHLAFDSNGDLYVCDNTNDRIRKIDMRTGTITTVLGNGQRASNGDGGPATEASILMPDALCFDSEDNLYVGEKYGFRVRKVDRKTGIVSTLVGNGVPKWGEEGLPGSETHCNSVEAGMWADRDGTVFWGDASGRLRKYDGKTGIVTTALGGTTVHDGEPADQVFLRGPHDVSIAPNRDIYIADTYNQCIRAVDAQTGTIRTVAGNGARAYGGDGGPATEAYLGNPGGVSVDSSGRVVIADTRHGHVRRVDERGTIHNVAGAAFQWDKGDGGSAINANLVAPQTVEHGPNDDIYIADAGVGRIRRVDSATGIISTVVGTGIPGYTGDGGLATEARIGFPTAIRFDVEGNLYFSDSARSVVRKVDAKTGIIETVLGSGEEGYSLDGTPALEARLGKPYGMEISADGTTIFVSDTANCRVRAVDAKGELITIAGSDDGGDFGDGGPAVNALLNYPYGLRLYGDQILLICDLWNNRIKAVRLE
jgi:sugar lactone lactonase YvrE